MDSPLLYHTVFKRRTAETDHPGCDHTRARAGGDLRAGFPNACGKLRALVHDPSRIHVLFVIPKRDELRAAGAVFGFSPDDPTLLKDAYETYETWGLQLGELSVKVVLADAQGTTKVALATRSALDKFDPSIAICLGTAAGRKQETSYLDVVIATAVLDASEWRAMPGRLEPQWDALPKPPREVLYDIDDFVKRNDWQQECRHWLDAALADLNAVAPSDVLEGWPCVRDGWAVTTGFLHQDRKFLKQIWGLHARLRAIDMETAGFVNACGSDSRRRPWFVLRAVSDYGTRESKRDELRAAAGAAAAAVSRSLVERGLRRAHPLTVDPKESGDARLSKESPFTRLTMPSFLAEELPKQLGVAIEPNSLTAELTVSDLAALCSNDERPAATVHPILDDLRETYFTRKYIDYDDKADVRGYTGPAWIEDVRDAYEFVGIDPPQADILYVGVGTGRDLPLVCPKFKSLTGVDISTAMLKRAKQVQPAITAVRDCAEDLANITDQTIDLYLSLRTYQSSLFDVAAALRQALRVLRGGGSLVLSIPGGFLDRTFNDELRYVPGLLVPGSNVVDRGLPRRIAERILSQLENLTFERIGFHQRETDLYIYARKRATAL
jgi:nucleoside phosphorylase/SAM-dependent methyltransferase